MKRGGLRLATFVAVDCVCFSHSVLCGECREWRLISLRQVYHPQVYCMVAERGFFRDFGYPHTPCVFFAILFVYKLEKCPCNMGHFSVFQHYLQWNPTSVSERYTVSSMRSESKLKAIDFFSGAGGLTYGLRNAGIQVLVGIDNDASCQVTFEKNNKGTVFFERDITKYTPKNLERELNIEREDDNMIFAGCAPCQFWSIIQTNKEKSKKTKNLILDFQGFVEYFKPGFIIVENVPGISSKPKSPMGKFIAALESIKYNVVYGITDMSLYGVPQRRKRFTLLASRVSNISLPKPTNQKKTVGDVLGTKNGFPKIRAGARDETSFLHTSAGLSEKNLKRLQMTKKNGGDRSRWQEKKAYQLPCYTAKEKMFYDTYGRMWWDKPAPTITTKFFSISNGRFAHPEENRALSLREGATLQTFPKNYEFIGTSTASIARMIGNAVPPKFAKIIGEQIIFSRNKMV